MKTFVIALLLGIILGAGGLWYLTDGRSTPAVQKAEDRAAAEAKKALEAAQALGQQAKKALEARLEVLELKGEDIQKELEEKGRVVRRKARDIGESAVDATLDTRSTAAIKAKLAAHPDLSALSISVTTSEGRVTLSGTVASADLIGKAMALALETDGVREVVSTLQVKSREGS